MGIRAIRKVFGKVTKVDKNGMPVKNDVSADEKPRTVVQELKQDAPEVKVVKPVAKPTPAKPVSQKRSVVAEKPKKKSVSDMLGSVTSKNKKNKRN